MVGEQVQVRGEQGERGVGRGKERRDEVQKEEESYIDADGDATRFY